MNIGIPKERRPYEYRVGLTPAAIQMLVKQGHKCYVEHDAGTGVGYSDQEYEKAGARVVYSGHEVFGRANLLVKIARPLLEEIEWLQQGAALAGLLHLNSARQDKIDKLIEKEITAIALEQIQLDDGSMPVRASLAQIGGQMAPQIAARLLQNDSGGKGIMIGGAPGVPPAEIVIIGAGIVGTGATQAFSGMGAHVTVLDVNMSALQRIHDRYPGVVTMVANQVNLVRTCSYADVVVGAVLVPGERAPIVITREMLKIMKPRSIIMDISIDDGGCVETSRPTTHDHPTFVEEGVTHYCVPNIPGVVARTSTHVFNNAAFPFILELANKGLDTAIAENPAIERGVNTYKGTLLHISRYSPLGQED
jgi:alanine dehydrogenase